MSRVRQGGYWQFERAGAVRGVMNHFAIENLAKELCKARKVPFDDVLIHSTLDLIAAFKEALREWKRRPVAPPALRDLIQTPFDWGRNVRLQEADRGAQTPEGAYARLRPLIGRDNEMGAHFFAPFLLAMPEVLRT
jgi:hypothetical protein